MLLERILTITKTQQKNDYKINLHQKKSCC
jgi:hypothetical protein